MHTCMVSSGVVGEETGNGKRMGCIGMHLRMLEIENSKFKSGLPDHYFSRYVKE